MGTPTNVRSPVMDPILTFKFVVKWELGEECVMRTVAGVSKIGPLSRATEVAEYGNAPGPVIPGQVKYEEISLERGIILDVAFERWANKTWFYEHTGTLGDEVSLGQFRKTLTIDLCNQAGQTIDRYYIFNCWPSKYQAIPDLESSGNVVALENLTLQNEGWQRDTSFVPSAYPSFSEPSSPVGGAPPG